MRKAADLALTHSRAHRSQIAVVSNPESEFFMDYRQSEANNLSTLLYQWQLGAFPRAGAPFDWYLADDLAAVVERNYKVVVFLDCQYLTGEQLRLAEALKRDGRTLVFFHAPGYVSDAGLSRGRMERLCGTKMKAGTFRGVLSAIDKTSGREWGCGLDRTPPDGLEMRKSGMWRPKPGMVQRGLFLPAEGETLTAGVGELDGVPTATMLRHEGWTGVFSALPALSPDALRRIWKLAGIHLYIENDAILSANDSWVMVHARAKGTHEVNLPRVAAKVTDVTCGKVAARNADRFAYPLERFQTAVFLVE